jgi:hypothetical protein
MGYIRKHKHDIRSGFEATLLITGILCLCPVIMMVAASSY